MGTDKREIHWMTFTDVPLTAFKELKLTNEKVLRKYKYSLILLKIARTFHGRENILEWGQVNHKTVWDSNFVI